MVSLRSILVAGAALFPAAASAAPLVSEPVLHARANTLCGTGGNQGIKKPENNATIQWTDDGATFQVIYCSGQYFKTSSVDGSVWLSNPSSTNGQLLIKSQAPDNKDAPAGYYSYRFNVTIYPEDGDYTTGQQTLGVYETATGYYNPANYFVSSINLNFVAPKSPQSPSYPS